MRSTILLGWFPPLPLRLVLVGSVCSALVFTPATRAQTIIDYTANSSTPLVTTPANSLILQVTSASDTFTQSGSITGNGSITKTGAGTLILKSSSFDFTGSVTVDAGTLQIDDRYALVSAKLIVNPGGGSIVYLPGPVYTDYFLVGALEGTGSLAIPLNRQLKIHGNLSTTFSGAFSGDGAFLMGGNGTLTLSGVSTLRSYSLDSGTLLLENPRALSRGAVYFYAGTLRVGALTELTLMGLNSDANSRVIDLTNSAGQPIALTVGRTPFANSLSYDAVRGDIIGISSLTKVDVSHQIFHGNYTTEVDIQGGKLRINGSLVGNVSVAAGTTYEYLTDTDRVLSNAITGAGSFTKLGNGTLTLSEPLGARGTIAVEGGALRLGSSERLANDTVLVLQPNGTPNRGPTLGTFDLNSFTETVASVNLITGAINGPGTLNASAFTVREGSISAALAGSGSLTKSGNGTVTLSGLNLYTGTTTIDGGTLTVMGELGGSGVTVNAGGTLGGSGTFTAPVVVASGGTVVGTGSYSAVEIQAGGLLSPGASPGLFQVAGRLTLAGTTLLEISGTGTRGLAYDAITAGSIRYGGTLQLSLLSGFTPALGNSFDLIDGATESGTFASLNLPALSSGLAWNTSTLYSDGVVRVVSAIPEPATYAALAGACGLALAAYRRRRRGARR